MSQSPGHRNPTCSQLTLIFSLQTKHGQFSLFQPPQIPLLGINFQLKAQDSSLTLPSSVPISRPSRACWFYFQISHMHSRLSIISPRELEPASKPFSYMEARGMLLNATLITPPLCLKSSMASRRGTKTKSLTGAMIPSCSCFSSVPQHQLALCHTDPSFVREPCSLLPLGLCTCSSHRHFAC